jgi:hypothetical protein
LQTSPHVFTSWYLLALGGGRQSGKTSMKEAGLLAFKAGCRHRLSWTISICGMRWAIFSSPMTLIARYGDGVKMVHSSIGIYEAAHRVITIHRTQIDLENVGATKNQDLPVARI